MILERLRRTDNTPRSVPEHGELVRRNYEASVISPERYMEELQELLLTATQVDIISMYARAGVDEPLSILAPKLAQVSERGGSVRIALSKNHQSHPDEVEFKADNDLLLKSLKEQGVNFYWTQPQGTLRNVNLKGHSGNVHSKFTQVHTPKKVITYMPEFNMTRRSMDFVNSSLRFEETREEAEREGSISKRVAEYMELVRSGSKFHDYSLDIDDELRLVVDSGKLDTSVIRSTAWQEVMGPANTDIVFLNQYPPLDSTLAGIKRKAREGVPSYILLSGDCLKGKFENSNRLFRRLIRGQEDKIHVFYYPKSVKNPNGVVHSKMLLANVGMQLTEEGKVTLAPSEGVKSVGLATSSNLFPVGFMFSTGEAGFLIKNQELLGKMAGVVEGQFNNASIFQSAQQ